MARRKFKKDMWIFNFCEIMWRTGTFLTATMTKYRRRKTSRTALPLAAVAWVACVWGLLREPPAAPATAGSGAAPMSFASALPGVAPGRGFHKKPAVNELAASRTVTARAENRPLAKAAGAASAEPPVKYARALNAPQGKWKHLTREMRARIDATGLSTGRWRRIELDSSGTEIGDARTLGQFQKDVQGVKGGLAWHFLIGNGTRSDDGEIEAGPRWDHQVPAAMALAGSDVETLHVALVGDFHHHAVTDAQLAALDELVDYLRAKIGLVEVEGRDKGRALGKWFPEKMLESAYSPKDES